MRGQTSPSVCCDEQNLLLSTWLLKQIIELLKIGWPWPLASPRGMFKAVQRARAAVLDRRNKLRSAAAPGGRSQ